MRPPACQGGCGKAIELRWWTCHPVTLEDDFRECGACHGAQPPGFDAEAHRQHQRESHCPKIPREEWIEPDAPAHLVGAASRTLLGTPDDRAGEGCHYCPGAYAREPVAIEAQRALDWWETGQLGHLYQDGVPEIVCDAVDVARATRAAWQREGARLRATSKKNET